MAKAKKKPAKLLTDKEKSEWPDEVERIYDALADAAYDDDLDADGRRSALKRKESFLKHVREQVDAPDPLSPYEIQAERAVHLKFELESLEAELDAHDDEKKRLQQRISEVETQIREAKRKSKPFKARIKTLPSEWQKHWLVTYDRYRESGKPKPEASALAWAGVKQYCTRTKPGTWSCPEWDDEFRATGKETARTKKALDAGDKRSEKQVKKIKKRIDRLRS